MLLDMATSAAAVGKMELAKALDKPIPSGWALNKYSHFHITLPKRKGALAKQKIVK